MYSGFCHGTHCIKTLLEKVARHMTYPQNTKVANHEWHTRHKPCAYWDLNGPIFMKIEESIQWKL